MKVNLSSKDIHHGSLIVVNGEHGLPFNYSCQTFPVDEHSGITMQRNAAVLLGKLLESAGNGEIVLVSGCRTAEEQQKIWDESLREN